MGYEQIDSILNDWAASNGLHIYSEYKDDEVRSVEFRGGRRDGYQIWIDKPDVNGLIGIHVWDFKRHGRRRDFSVSYVDLREHLEVALQIANKWLSQ